MVFVNSVRYSTVRYANQKCSNYEQARKLCEKFEPAWIFEMSKKPHKKRAQNLARPPKKLAFVDKNVQAVL